MTKITYGELLKDPRWQKKRLEIFNRDKWTCQGCWSKDNTLHVHHFEYTVGSLPWEYPDENFCTLCEGCHKLEEDFRQTDVFKAYSIKARIPAVQLWWNMATVAFLFAKDEKYCFEVMDQMAKRVKEIGQEDFYTFIKLNGGV